MQEANVGGSEGGREERRERGRKGRRERGMKGASEHERCEGIVEGAMV